MAEGSTARLGYSVVAVAVAVSIREQFSLCFTSQVIVHFMCTVRHGKKCSKVKACNSLDIRRSHAKQTTAEDVFSRFISYHRYHHYFIHYKRDKHFTTKK